MLGGGCLDEVQGSRAALQRAERSKHCLGNNALAGTAHRKVAQMVRLANKLSAWHWRDDGQGGQDRKPSACRWPERAAAGLGASGLGSSRSFGVAAKQVRGSEGRRVVEVQPTLSRRVPGHAVKVVIYQARRFALMTRADRFATTKRARIGRRADSARPALLLKVASSAGRTG